MINHCSRQNTLSRSRPSCAALLKLIDDKGKSVVDSPACRWRHGNAVTRPSRDKIHAKQKVLRKRVPYVASYEATNLHQLS